MKIAVCGYGRHGKETAAKYLAKQLCLKYEGCTSQIAAKMVFNVLGPVYGYKDALECWCDRAYHRAEWYDIIKEYNKPDGLTLYRDMAAANDIIDGIRDRDELKAAIEAGICSFSVWIDASGRVPPEAGSSCTIGREDCTYVIDNNGTIEQLYANIDMFIDGLKDGGL